MAVLLYARDERRLEAVDMYPLRYEDHTAEADINMHVSYPVVNLSISTRSKKKEEDAVEWLDGRAVDIFVLHSLLTAGRRR
jgi:hypothetical protein